MTGVFGVHIYSSYSRQEHVSELGEVAQTWVVAAGGGDSMRHRSSTLICYRPWTATRWRKRHTYSVTHMKRDF